MSRKNCSQKYFLQPVFCELAVTTLSVRKKIIDFLWEKITRIKELFIQLTLFFLTKW